MSEAKKDEPDLSALLCEVELNGNYFDDCNLLMAKIDKLQQFARLFAECPCCYEIKECRNGCEFADGRSVHMNEARKALFT